MNRLCLGIALSVVLVAAGCNTSKSPTAPTDPVITIVPAPAPPAPPPAVVSGVTVSGTSAFTQRGATSQLTAMVTLSNGTTENRTSTATWQSDNAAVATVSAAGVVTAQGDGDATISATVSEVRGTRPVSVRTARRTPDPPAGQRLPLPDVQAFVMQRAAARPDLLAQSCPTGNKYVNNPWQDYMVDGLRELDTRWGYNGKPNRGPADNGGQPVIAAGDEIAYHYGPGPDQGSTDV